MVNNKQYVIMDEPFMEQDFLHIPLYGGKVLSYHKNLPAQVKMCDDKLQYCLLGYVYQVDPERATPMEELELIHKEADVHAAIESWAGSWLLIYKDRIYMDACGSLGCFYSQQGVISRSIHCINQALNRRDKSPRITHKFGLDYFPGPNTPYDDISRLLPSETLCFTDFTKGKRDMVPFVNMYNSDDERIEAFLTCFSTMLQYFVKDYDGRIYIPLTGGYDSRTLIALLEYCNVTNYKLFTMEHENLTEEDKELPPLIADKLQRPYEFIVRSSTVERKRYYEFDKHCGQMAVDEDRNFYAYRQYPETKEGYALLRANIWEIAWGKYYKKISSYGADISKFKKQYVNVRRRDDIRASIEKWFAHIQNNVQNIPFANRFYWEQRVGCWLSSVEQSLTIMDGVDSIPLCNCNRMLSILLDFDIEKRMNKEHQVMLIQKTCPELLDIPFMRGKTIKKPNMMEQEIQHLCKCFRCLDFMEAVKEERRHILQLLRKRKGKKNEKKD